MWNASQMTLSVVCVHAHLQHIKAKNVSCYDDASKTWYNGEIWKSDTMVKYGTMVKSDTMVKYGTMVKSDTMVKYGTMVKSGTMVRPGTMEKVGTMEKADVIDTMSIGNQTSSTS